MRPGQPLPKLPLPPWGQRRPPELTAPAFFDAQMSAKYSACSDSACRPRRKRVGAIRDRSKLHSAAGMARTLVSELRVAW